MSAIYISAAHKSSGKTTVSLGLCAAFARQGLTVQAFKKGPDYIDPAWLQLASGRPCYNLDSYTAGHAETLTDFATRSRNTDLAVIEGNKGLHDGLDLDGSNSNAALAKSLNTPVILVIDARGTMRGIAPLLIGYQVFDPAVKIAGVIANRTGGSRHEGKLRAAVEHYTDIPYLGALPNTAELGIAEKHLGLVPGYELGSAQSQIATIADAVETHTDLAAIRDIANTHVPENSAVPAVKPSVVTPGLRIGIARDAAFGFYYAGDLDAFTELGATLVPVDTFNDPELPALDGLFIGGGFPERHAARLQANRSLRESIRNAIDNGLPVYAECGGLMYLARSLSWNGVRHEMVGAFAGDILMHEKPRGRGYVQVRENSDVFPWPANTDPTTVVSAHEFHYSSIEELPNAERYAYRVERGNGIDGCNDGLVFKHVLASYTHLRHTRSNPWVQRFLQFVEQCRGRDPIRHTLPNF